MLQDEYHVIERSNNNAYPLFAWDQPSGDTGLGKPSDIEHPVKFRLADSTSSKFEWVDYHSSPAPVVSQKIVDALVPLSIYGIQGIPAKVRNPDNNDPYTEAKDYWLLHVWNRIACLDRENSELDLYSDGEIFGIEKLVLDEELLGAHDLTRRLIFELAEKDSVLLVHQSVKETIESVNAVGCRFFKVSEWYSDIVFDD